MAPAWLISQWLVTIDRRFGGARPLAFCLIFTALCYLSARANGQTSAVRRALVHVGGIALLPCAAIAIITAEFDQEWAHYNEHLPLPFATLLVGWMVAAAAPLILSWLLRRRGFRTNFLWAVWTYALVLSAGYAHSFQERGTQRRLGATLALYLLCALGSAGLVAWGLYERRKERVNLGIAAFAISVLFFYFDSFMGKIGRSASLLLLGVLCLAGGYALEVTRRRLLGRMVTNP